ncbi:MAG: D-aminoacyl-tRNA deacylase [Chloroflexota bacterium]
MKVLLQRVSGAAVRVDGHIVGQIGRGYCLLVGVTHSDTNKEAEWLANKVAGLRIFEDENNKLNLGINDVGGELLIISQFTLYADTQKGRRPSFIAAARPEQSEPLYDYFCELMANMGFRVATGQFGADMKVEIHNDGPITIILEREKG